MVLWMRCQLSTVGLQFHYRSDVIIFVSFIAITIPHNQQSINWFWTNNIVAFVVSSHSFFSCRSDDTYIGAPIHSLNYSSPHLLYNQILNDNMNNNSSSGPELIKFKFSLEIGVIIGLYDHRHRTIYIISREWAAICQRWMCSFSYICRQTNTRPRNRHCLPLWLTTGLAVRWILFRISFSSASFEWNLSKQLSFVHVCNVFCTYTRACVLGLREWEREFRTHT